MWILLVVIVATLLGGIIWLLTIDGSYHVKKSVLIKATPEEVYQAVADFNTWTIWSPWLCMEPTAEVTISADEKSQGAVYAWVGKMVGSGEIEHKQLDTNTFIDQQIRFHQPFKSQSDVYWEFESAGEGTKVTWGMRGKMPFFFRFMAKQMEPWIGMDYERGLKMLKDYLEKGSIASHISIEGIAEFPETHYVGIKVTCPMDEVGPSMKKSFTALGEFCANEAITYDKAFSVYHKFDFTDPECTYTSAVPVVAGFTVSNEAFYAGRIPALKAVKVVFTGDYEHLGNGWSAAYSYLRYKKLKQNKTIDPLEVYITDPLAEPDPAKWITEIYLPIK